MYKTGGFRPRASMRKMPFALRGLALIFALCVIFRLISAAGADSAINRYTSGLFENKNAIVSILDSELGAAGDTGGSVSVAALVLDPSIYGGQQEAKQAAVPPESPQESSQPTPSPAAAGQPPAEAPASENSDTSGSSTAYYNNWNQSGSSGGTPKVITQPAEATNAHSIAVNNKTGYSVDTTALLKEPLKIKLTAKSPAVLIIHTHSSEAYLPAGKDQYTPSDPFRTEDKAQSIIRVGDELTQAFEKKGISVIHDTGLYDYPSYEGAYDRSYAAIQSYLKKYPSIKMVIDMHRDAIEAADGSVYKTIAQIGGSTCSQILMVMGTNYSGLNHPNWRENFKLALHIQQEMNKLYPSLAKPIELSQYRYNQQATLGSMIVEVGTTGNTLQESLAAVRYFADAASDVLLTLYK